MAPRTPTEPNARAAELLLPALPDGAGAPDEDEPLPEAEAAEPDPVADAELFATLDVGAGAAEGNE